jgi:hypothetical protein
VASKIISDDARCAADVEERQPIARTRKMVPQNRKNGSRLAGTGFGIEDCLGIDL